MVLKASLSLKASVSVALLNAVTANITNTIWSELSATHWSNHMMCSTGQQMSIENKICLIFYIIYFANIESALIGIFKNVFCCFFLEKYRSVTVSLLGNLEDEVTEIPPKWWCSDGENALPSPPPLSFSKFSSCSRHWVFASTNIAFLSELDRNAWNTWT